ncbi:MAG TPA: hypothetical protein VNF06_00160 [Candidatus Aquilonibacter sp.]|nr:hypothetical protein [Candidatus Aquilonibacter sp.]
MAPFEIFKAIFRSRLIIALTAIVAIAYYFLIQYVIALNAPGGYVFITTPAIMFYLLAISASLLLVISAYSIKLSLLTMESEVEGAASIISAFLGGIIAGCNCSVPIIASILYLFALNAATVSTVIAFIGNYQLEIFALLVLFNIAVSYHHLERLSATCTIKKGRLQRKR